MRGSSSGNLEERWKEGWKVSRRALRKDGRVLEQGRKGSAIEETGHFMKECLEWWLGRHLGHRVVVQNLWQVSFLRWFVFARSLLPFVFAHV